MNIRDEKLLVIGGLLVFVLTLGVLLKEQTVEWKKYQKEFIQLVTDKLGPKVAGSVEPGLHQIWNPRLKVTDRCQTCHLGIDIPGLENEEQPFATHPDLAFYKKTHPFKDFGCTTCHDGQGYATRAEDAHGQVHHWMTPMYSAAMAREYGFADIEPMVEMKCNQCHRQDHQTERMEAINLAKKLVEQHNCTICHIIEGEGRTVGPELTFEGSKFPEEFMFDRVEGKKSILNWHMEHFKNPQKVSKDSLMINFVFSDQEARSLALLMMSWKKDSVPATFIPSPYRSELTKPRPAPTIPPGKELDGPTLYRVKYCITCHGENGRSTTGVYPSLAGQTFYYLVNQLNDIKSGARKWRNSNIMKPLVQDLTDEQISAISKYLSEIRRGTKTGSAQEPKDTKSNDTPSAK